MNIKLTFLAASAALATFTIGASAEAITLGSSYTIGGEGNFTSTQLTFNGFGKVTDTSGDFNTMKPSPILGGGLGIVVFPSVFDITSSESKLLVEFQEILAGSFIVDSDYNFFANSVTFLSDVNRYKFTGTFGDGTKGIGELSQNLSVKNGDFVAYTATFQAVPTPALLPGLIGMGIAALRRKDEESTEENA